MESKRLKPMYKDPIYDGATDPVVIFNEKENCWYMFYTQRRASDITIGVSNIHGTKIGVASSANGANWVYRGTLQGLDFEKGHNTFWAPEIIFAEGQYHMYVSYITGIPTTWDHERHIIHYTSDNLWDWTYHGSVPLSSQRVIDACVYKINKNTYKMWYKDENNNSYSYAAVSHDLFNWEVVGPEITDVSHEGPNVFELGGIKWMITDFWDGLGVYRTENFISWERQKENILNKPGIHEEDKGIGHHADVVVNGDEAYIFYFVHPNQEDDSSDALTKQYLKSRTTVLAARLTVENGILCCDRDEEFEMSLGE